LNKNNTKLTIFSDDAKEEFVINKLENELQANIYFHNAKHTKDVYTLTELIGRAEDISQEDLLMLRTAGLFIDTGFITNYDDYENENIRFARDILPKYRYSREQIDNVCNLIMSVNHNENNKGRIEGILYDAYHNYIGRIDFIEHSRRHFQEVKERVASLTEKEWFYHELRIVEKFKFCTNTAKMLTEVSIEEQVLKIKEFAKLN